MTPTARLTVAGGAAAALSLLPMVPITEQSLWLVPALIAVAVVVLSGYGLRRTRLPRAIVPLVQLVVLTSWLGLLVAADVAWMIVVPTPAWFERIGMVISQGADTIVEHTAPVPVDQGLQFLIVAGAGLVAIGVETAVFGLRRITFAGIPIAVFYTIAASVVREGWWWLWFVPPAVGFVGLLIADSQERVARWGRSAGATARRTMVPETGTLARSGRRAGTVAVAAAVLIPVALPVLSVGLIDGPGSGGSGSGRTIRTDNPIVDLRRDLVRPDNVEMMRYVTDAASQEYIRTATLDVFNGDEWSLSQRDVPSSQRIDEGLPWPPGPDPDEDVRLVTYEFRISENFGSRWLPLAYPAQEIDIGGDWRYVLSTLDVVSPEDDVQGAGYSATSIEFNRDPAALRESSRVDPDEFAPMLELPDDMAERLEEYLDEAVGELTNPHEQAVALQAWFRNGGGFEYSLEPSEGTSSDHLIDFLTERVGYCEQYSATMAIMARALGIPARVAVGFTPGDPLEEEAGRVIRAHDAHAWPELYFEEAGWVRFEPTPARRTGVAPSWTLDPRDPADDLPGGDPGFEELDPTDAESLPVDGSDFADAMGGGAATDPPARWPWVLLVLAAVATVVALPHLIGRVAHTARWQRAGDDPVAVAEAAWLDFRDAVRDTGLRWDDAATPRGVRRLVSGQLGGGTTPPESMNRLVQAIEHARYAAHIRPDPLLEAVAADLRRTILLSQSRPRRVRALLLPVGFTDLLRTAVQALGSGLGWLDTAGERLRGSLIPVTRR